MRVDRQLPQLRHVTPRLRVYSGSTSLSRLPEELDRANARCVAIFCGASIARTPGVLDRVAAAIGKRLAGSFQSVKAHSPLPSVLDAVEALRRLEADAIIAIGGGSAVVTARAAAILLGEDKDIHELCTRIAPDGSIFSPKLDAAKLPQFVIPTTPSTGFTKAGAAVLDPGIGKRLALFDPKVRASSIFIEPECLLTAPASLVFSAALQSFCAAIQGIEANTRDPLADALLLHSLRLFRQNLPLLSKRPFDTDVRAQLVFAGILSGQGTDFTGSGVAAALGHSLAARHHVVTGLANALLLPHTILFNAEKTGRRMLDVVEILGGSASSSIDAPATAAKTLQAFLTQFDMPNCLRQFAIPREELAQVAEDAMGDWFLRQNPRRVSDVAELKEILEAAY